jgi:type II secretory pathway pseudopilin PulG
VRGGGRRQGTKLQANDHKLRWPAATDHGSTFIEVLVSVVLLGIGAIAVLAGLAAAIRGASVHSDVTDAQSWLATAGDVLVEVPPSAADNYEPCTTPTSTIIDEYQAVVDGVDGIPPTSDITVEDVEFWNSTLGEFGSTCRYSTAEEDRLQRITLATQTAGAVRRLSVVKRPALEPSINVGTPPTTQGGGNYEPEPNPDL